MLYCLHFTCFYLYYIERTCQKWHSKDVQSFKLLESIEMITFVCDIYRPGNKVYKENKDNGIKGTKPRVTFVGFCVILDIKK